MCTVREKEQFMYTPTATISDVVYLQLYRNLKQRGGRVVCVQVVKLSKQWQRLRFLIKAVDQSAEGHQGTVYA